jgi:hypothetical protein
MSLADSVTSLPERRCGSYQSSRLNALRHGVLSQHTVLPWEDPDEYRQLAEALAAEHNPQGPTEEALRILASPSPTAYSRAVAALRMIPGRGGNSRSAGKPVMKKRARNRIERMPRAFGASWKLKSCPGTKSVDRS